MGNKAVSSIDEEEVLKVTCASTHSLAYLLTHSLTYSLTNLLTLTHSHSFTYLPMRTHTIALVYRWRVAFVKSSIRNTRNHYGFLIYQVIYCLMRCLKRLLCRYALCYCKNFIQDLPCELIPQIQLEAV